MKTLNGNIKATIVGYLTAVINSLVVLDLDNMDYSLPSNWVKLFVAIVMPIFAGHITEIKSK